MAKKRTQIFWRSGIYVLGLLMAALGVVFSSVAGFGIPPITSIPSAISAATGLNFSLMVCLFYSSLVLLQFVVKGKNREWKDLLQVPFAFAFSSSIEMFSRLLSLEAGGLAQRIALLAVGMVLMAVGGACVVRMELIPCPPDGLIYAVSVKLGKELGLMKNIADMVGVVVTCAVDLLFTGRIYSIGIGSLACMVGLGRIIALFDWLCKEKVQRLAGIGAYASQEGKDRA